MAAPYDEIATAIITAQKKMMGDAPAADTARRTTGISVDPAGGATVIGDGNAAIDALVKAYSAVSGPLAERMCFMAASSLLTANPTVKIPSFARF